MSKKSFFKRRFIAVATLFSIPVVGLSVALSLYTKNNKNDKSSNRVPSIIDNTEIDKLKEQLEDINKKKEDLEKDLVNANKDKEDLEKDLVNANKDKNDLQDIVENSEINEISEYQIVNKTKEQFNNFLTKSKLTEEVTNLNPTNLANEIYDFTKYINLKAMLTLYESKSIDLNSIEFYNWEYDIVDNVKRKEKIETLKLEENGEYQRKLITFYIIDTDKDEKIKISIAFVLSPSGEEVKNQISSTKKEIIDKIEKNDGDNDLTYSKEDNSFTRKISIDKYDETILLANNNESKKFFYELLRLDQIEKHPLPHDIKIRQKIYEINKDGEKKEVKKIDLNHGYYKDGHIIEFDIIFNEEEDEIKEIYKENWKLKIFLKTNETDELKTNFLLFNSRLANFRKQIRISKEDTENFKTLNEKPLYVSKAALDTVERLGFPKDAENIWKIAQYEKGGKKPSDFEAVKDEEIKKLFDRNQLSFVGPGNSKNVLGFTEILLSNRYVMNMVKYIFGDFEKKFNDYSADSPFSTLRTDLNFQNGSLNSGKGLLNSALGVSSYLYFIESIKEKLKVDITLKRTVDPEEGWDSNPLVAPYGKKHQDAYRYDMKIIPSWRLEVKFHNDEGFNEKFAFHLASNSEREYSPNADYRFINDLLNSSKKGVLKYDSYSNILEINTDRLTFEKYREEFKKYITYDTPNGKNSIYTQTKMVEALYECFGSPSNKIDLEKYGSDFKLYEGSTYESDFKDNLEDKSKNKYEFFITGSHGTSKFDPTYWAMDIEWNIIGE